MYRADHNHRIHRSLCGFELLESRRMLSADLGQFIPVNTAGGLPEFEAYVDQQAETIKGLLDAISVEQLDFILAGDLLGIADLVAAAKGLAGQGFNPQQSDGVVVLEVPDLVDPQGWDSRDSDGSPAAADPWTLLRPAGDLGSHAGGIASTDPTKDTSNNVRSLSTNEHRNADGSETSYTNGSGSRVTVRDAAGGTHGGSGLEIVGGTQIRVVKPNGTIISFSSYELEDGTTFSGRAAVNAAGRGDAHFRTTPGRPNQSADPDAEPTAVILPHQHVPDFNPRTGLTGPDQIQPGHADESVQQATKIDPGESIAVNPAGEVTQARQASQALAEHWKNELAERAGGLVNPESP